MGLHGKDKHPRDIKRHKNKISQRKKNKIKETYKGIKKENYKKKKNIDKVDCCICFSSVDNTSDNSVKCGKTIHFICGECKFRCNETGNETCPMCRSHPIKNPIARDHNLTIYTKFKKPHSIYPDDPSRMSMKQRRNEHRKTYYLAPFHCNTNRIVSQRKRWTYRVVDHNLTFEGWIPESRALHYNGVDYNEIIYEDDASSTASTLTLVDWQDDEVDSQADDLSEYMDMVLSAYE